MSRGILNKYQEKYQEIQKNDEEYFNEAIKEEHNLVTFVGIVNVFNGLIS